MRHFLIMLVVGLLTLGPALQDAEARRLGGGKTFGTQSRTVQQQPAATQQNSATGNRTAQGGIGSRMPGMLGGMLAGGLLAALFFGGAFDELRLMDILVVAGIAFLLLRLFARRRPAMAGGPGHPAGAPRSEADTADGPPGPSRPAAAPSPPSLRGSTASASWAAPRSTS